MNWINKKTYTAIAALVLFFSFVLTASASVPAPSAKSNSKLVLKIKEDSYKISAVEFDQWLKKDYQLSFSKNYRSEIENTDWCAYKKSLPCFLMTSYKKENHIQKTVSISPHEENIKSYLKDLARQVNKDPQNAKLKIEGGRATVFSLEGKGITIDEEKSFAYILDYLKNPSENNSIDLVYSEPEPEISIESIDTMGVSDLVGTGRSNFRGSPRNRIHNIKVAASRFDGILIKPEEEFSFVKNLGEVDGEHGYLPELVIKKNKTEPEFGGGICQVSTTAFRSAIYAGLEITARRNHAYPVSYYNPQGMDSTVYIPRPDLRFINNTPGYILIQTRIEGTELIFDFYGKSDGRRINVIGPEITERTPEGGLKTVFTQEVYDSSDNLIRKDTFKSSYDSPDKYPHPATTNEILKSKPKDWSKKEWENYKKANGI